MLGVSEIILNEENCDLTLVFSRLVKPHLIVSLCIKNLAILLQQKASVSGFEMFNGEFSHV